MTGAKRTERVLGADLRPGDTVAVWWQPGYDTITALPAYHGPLAYLFRHGASLASFALNKNGMTIDHGGLFDRVTTA